MQRDDDVKSLFFARAEGTLNVLSTFYLHKSDREVLAWLQGASPPGFTTWSSGPLCFGPASRARG